MRICDGLMASNLTQTINTLISDNWDLTTSHPPHQTLVIYQYFMDFSLWKPEYFQCSHLSIFYYIIYVDVIHILIAANDRWYWDFKVYSITRLHVSKIFCQYVLFSEPLTCACWCGACKCMCPVSGIIIIISHVSSDHNLPKHQGTPTWTLKLSRT